MNYKKLKNICEKEEKQSFFGWDFSHLNNRWENEKLKWNYFDIIKNHLRDTDNLLDIGTGGGEFLLTLNHPYKLTSVTEAYPPNFELCKEKLSPIGISVNQTYKDNVLPFDNDTFDIIINRHAAFDLNEVYRVLKSGGYFITQQVGNRNNNELRSKLLSNFEPNVNEKHTLHHYLENLSQMNYSIEFSDEQFLRVKFLDIGALVYYAKIIEWEFPHFSVSKCFDNICKCQTEIEQNGYIQSKWHRFIIVAQKTKD